MSRAVSITRTVRDLRKLGLRVTEVVVDPDGTVHVLTGEAPASPSDELAELRARRNARKTDRAA